MNKFLKFALVGSIGFIVDAIILLVLVHIFDQTIIFSRIIAFFLAVFVTWIINRNFTFLRNTSYKKGKEYIYYLTIQTIGAILNLIIFIVLIDFVELFKNYLILPLGIASILVMFFNYFMIKNKIYS